MSVALNTSPVVQSWQAALEAQMLRDESSRRMREAAFADFLQAGLPTQKLDAWKYTDLRRLSLRQFKLPERAIPSANVASALLPMEYSRRLIFVDGALSAELSTLETNAADATTEISIRRTQDNSATRLSSLEKRADASAFELLNRALATDVLHIEIAATAHVAEPLYCAFVWTEASANVMSHPQVTLNVGRQAQLAFIEHHIGLNATANFSNVTIKIGVAENAKCMHARVQEDAAANFLISNLHARIERGASYIQHQYIFGSGLTRCDLQIQLAAAEAYVELHGLLLAQANQHVDVRTCIEHQSPHTRSVEDYRGIADGRGRVVFNGKVIVHRDAQKTDARQSSRNLLLSPTAEIDTRPELEIYANDVQCAHGATVGQLDASALFYLQSRGIALADARALLTHAFAAELLERLPHAATRDYVLTKLMQRLGSRVSAQSI